MAHAHKYIARTLLWHTVENQYYKTGRVVPLDHLEEEVVERLIAQGLVKQATAADIKASEALEAEDAAAAEALAAVVPIVALEETDDEPAKTKRRASSKE